MGLYELNLIEMDKGLTELEKQEWESIYASYRGRSVITGNVVGVDIHDFSYIPDGEEERVQKTMRCLIIIQYRVKVIIPEHEVFMNSTAAGYHVLHSMCGAKIDYVITHVDREAGFAIASRKIALEQVRKANAKRKPKEGNIVNVNVVSVGKSVCTVTYKGYDVVLPQKEISYSMIPDLRDAITPGETKKALIKKFDKDENILKLSIKEATPHPFDGVELRHPIGSTRISKIIGKYGGGVFCRLHDDITDVLCSYGILQNASDFKHGDKVEILITRYNIEKKLIYGRIVRKLK